MKYKIILDKQSRTNPSSEKKEYEIDIEELRTRRNVYDSIVITREEAYVLRKLTLSDLQVLSELPEPVKEPLNDLKIELFEGDNYIYLVDMVGNKFYAEYLIKNEFTDMYATKNEMNAAINNTAQSIELSVNQKLEGYSTTEQMNAIIQLLSQNILLEVSKKVNNEDYTKANIILKINNNTSEAKINADVIELSANDILNLLAGNAINLTSKNIIISSDKFSVDKNGKVTCSDINITGGNIILKTTRNGQLFKIIVDGNEDTGFITTPQSLQFNFNGDDRADFGVNNSGNGFMSIMNSSGQTTSVHGEGINTPGVTINGEGSVMYGMNTHKYRCNWTGSRLQFWVDETNIGTLSDKRLKTEIKDIDIDLINAIKEIEMKQFKIANRNGLISFGILAQDLIEIFKKYNKNPFDYEIVQETQYKTDDNTIYYTINYEQYLLLKSKAQEKELEELKERIQKLEVQNGKN